MRSSDSTWPPQRTARLARLLPSLVARGLSGVQLVISDDHTGLVDTIEITMAGASWQRCRTHYLANLLTKVPKSSGSMVATTVRTIFAQPDPDQVWAQHHRVVGHLTEAGLTDAADHLDQAVDEILTYEQGALACSLEQCVRGDRGAHTHRLDGAGVGIGGDQPSDALYGGVVVVPGVVREQLVREHATCRRARHDVGERAAAIDPELPASQFSIHESHPE